MLPSCSLEVGAPSPPKLSLLCVPHVLTLPTPQVSWTTLTHSEKADWDLMSCVVGHTERAGSEQGPRDEMRAGAFAG